MVDFDRVAHLVRVPVRVGDDAYRFLVDTGIGLTVVSPAIAARADVRSTGETMTGRRMSGQQIEAPLVNLPTVTLGEYTLTDHVAGVADLGDEFDGILGPDFFAGHTVVTDPAARTLTMGDPAQPRGYEIPLEIRREGVAVSGFAALVLPSGRQVSVEVDTGSDCLILDTRFAADCGVDLDGPGVETKTGVDETGYHWTRHWAPARGSVHLAAALLTAQDAPRTMFQDIIYDGLIGTAYLDRFSLTMDYDGARMFLRDLRVASGPPRTARAAASAASPV